MPIITKLSSTGYTGEYSTTSGGYTISGKFSCDENKAIRNFSGDISTSEGDKKGSFSVSLYDDNSSIQDNLMSIIKTVRGTLDTELDA